MELSDKQKLWRLREMAIVLDEIPEDKGIKHEDLLDLLNEGLVLTGGN